MSAPSPHKHEPEAETTLLGTLGWVAVTGVLAVVALIVLNWLGPLGGR